MSKKALVLALAVLLGLALWLVTARTRAGDERERRRQAELERSSAELEQRAADPPPAELRPARTQLEAEPSQSPVEAAPEVVEPAVELPDLAARDWLEILVQDPEESPIFDAELTIEGVRKEGDRGSWYEMRDGPATARTDPDGRARIPYVRWVDIDARTIEVDLEVTHPEFVAFRDDTFAIGPGQHPVTLQRGATVVVAAWTGSPGNLLLDLRVRVDRESQVPSSAWVLEKDGRLATTRLAPGNHWISLSHESAEHGSLASAFVGFELAENEWKELSIELRPRLTLRGRLDDLVPRPVIDGHVWVNLRAGGDGQNPVLDDDFEAPVQTDGTFEVAGLPAARGQLIASCDGWVSKRVRVEAPADAGISFAPDHEPGPAEIERALEEAGDRAFQAQYVRVPAAEPVVVAMERTGTLEVTVLSEDRTPLAGATVSAWPNVFWVGVGSTIFPGSEWSAATDSLGRARIEGLPPDDQIWFGARHSSHRLTRAHRDRSPSAPARSGETTTFELVLERGQE